MMDVEILNQYILENQGGPFVTEEDIVMYFKDLHSVSP